MYGSNGSNSSFTYTDGGVNSHAAWVSSVTPPTDPPYTRNTRRPNIMLEGLAAPPAPDCALLNSPANGATGITLSLPLTWSAPASGPAPTGYQVYYGTSATPPLVNTVTATTFFYRTNPQTNNTTYYWKIVPVYSGTEASGCAVRAYTTVAATCPAGLGPGTVNIASLPYAASGLSTCGNGKSVTSNNTAICGSSSNYATDDKTFIFTPTTTANYAITITNNASTDPPGLNLYSSCPFGGSCIGFQHTSDASATLVANLTAGVTYYLVVDNTSGDFCLSSFSLSINLALAAPNCAITNTPGNGATNVLFNTPLTWSAPASGTSPTQYNVYYGTSATPPLVATLPATTFSYTPTNQSNNTLYYWQIVPVNSEGVAATGCAINSFTTVPATCPEGMGVGTVQIASLPYSASGLTSCGTGNDYILNDCAGGYHGGEDKTFVFTPAVTASHTIYMSNISLTGYAVLSLYTGCPFSGVCTSYTSYTTAGNSLTLVANLTAGVTYYLVVDNASQYGNLCLTNFSLDISTTAASPNCAPLNTPVNGATGVELNAPLTWSAPATGSAPTAYKVYHGTAANPPLVTTLPATDLAYTPANQVANTTYYWRIVPTNGSGDATGCAINSFTTRPANCSQDLGAGTVNIASLPYSASGLTTCGNGNNVTAANAIPCDIAYGGVYDAEDKTFVFTPTTTDRYAITISNGTYNGYGALTLYAGCPFSGSCLAYTGAYDAGTKTLVVNLTAGVTYYLVVDNWFGPTCLSSFSLNIALAPPAPDCVSLHTPANGATDINLTTRLTWSAPTGGVPPTKYKIYYGTSPTPPLVSTYNNELVSKQKIDNERFRELPLHDIFPHSVV